MHHDFGFNHTVFCLCGHSLTGELQKGHVYYRWHTRDCPVKSFREGIEEAVAGVLETMPENQIPVVAFRQAVPHEKRMLLSELRAKITVRRMVRTAEGYPQLSCTMAEIRYSSELSRKSWHHDYKGARFQGTKPFELVKSVEVAQILTWEERLKIAQIS